MRPAAGISQQTGQRAGGRPLAHHPWCPQVGVCNYLSYGRFAGAAWRAVVERAAFYAKQQLFTLVQLPRYTLRGAPSPGARPESSIAQIFAQRPAALLVLWACSLRPSCLCPVLLTQRPSLRNRAEMRLRRNRSWKPHERMFVKRHLPAETQESIL